jgi:SHS family lactate transporter-like MFS transporter
MISAPAAQIASIISESIEIHVDGEARPDYAITQAAMMSVIFTLLLIWTACGTEQRGSHFELARVAGETGNDEKTRQLEEAETQKDTEVEMEKEERAVQKEVVTK